MASFPRSFARSAAVGFCCLVFAGLCATAQNSASNQALLPRKFSGWTQQAAAKTEEAPADFDAANSDVLAEYGLKDSAENTYRRGDSRITVRAMRFADATGAFGAFTFYRKGDMKPEAIGRGGAGNAHEAVFWAGTTVVDATFPSAPGVISSLQSLAKALQPAAGSSGVSPTLPDYLPVKSLDRTTVRYAIGPAAYAKGGGVLPPEAIAFNRDAEAVTAQYAEGGGQGTLTLLEYPTPQMAITAEKSIASLLKGPLPATLQKSSPAALGVHRAGPLVAVTCGNFSSQQAQALLAQVKYQANVTWNQGDRSGIEIHRAASMLVGIAYLTIIIAGCAFVVGFSLGGGRALWRVMRGRPASSMYEQDFISLNLSDWQHSPTRKLP